MDLSKQPWSRMDNNTNAFWSATLTCHPSWIVTLSLERWRWELLPGWHNGSPDPSVRGLSQSCFLLTPLQKQPLSRPLILILCQLLINSSFFLAVFTVLTFVRFFQTETAWNCWARWFLANDWWLWTLDSCLIIAFILNSTSQYQLYSPKVNSGIRP